MTTSTTKARKLGDLVRASKDARPPDQTGWGSEAPTVAATAEPPAPAESAEAPKATRTAAANRATRKGRAAEKEASPASAATQELPAYLQLERVQTRVDPEVMTAIRTAEVRLKAARRPTAVAGERLNTNTVIRAALRAVVDSGALETCSGATEDELVASIRRQLQLASN